MANRRNDFLSIFEFWIIISIYGTTYICCTHGMKRNESRLLNDLLKNYDVNERPVANASDTVNVRLRLLFKELIDLDEPTQSMKSLVWLKITWTDVNLKWDSSKYGDYSTTRIDPSRIWRPDLTLYSNVHEDGGVLDNFRTRITLNANGTAMWLAPAILESSCILDIKKFPFDKQKCHLKIGSWAHDGPALNLNMETKDEPDINSYARNAEWELTSAYAKKNTIVYQCCRAPFYDITYTFHFHRKPLYYIVTIIFPCVLLSFLGTISFLFPAESGERITLVISVLLGLIVFMLIVNKNTPVSSDSVPMITVYFNASAFSVFFSLVSTAFVLRMSYCSTLYPVTGFLKKNRDFVARLLCMKKERCKKSEAPAFGKILVAGIEQRFIIREQLVASAMRQKKTGENILIELKKFSKRFEDEDLAKEIKEDWKYTGRVLDKLFFYFFQLAFISLSLYVVSFLV